MLRILHITEVTWGGVVELLRHFTSEQTRQGHTVHVLSPRPLGLSPGVSHIHWRLDRRNAATWLPALRHIQHLVDSGDYDAVHLHSFMAGLLGRLPRSVFAQVPIIYQPHSWSFDLFTGFRRRAIKEWERYAARRTSILVANCNDEIAEGVGAGVAVESRVPGVCVDTGHFRPPSVRERSDAQSLLPIPDLSAVIVLGRISFQKGQDLLVSRWEQDPIRDCQLILVGPGDTDTLAKLAPREWNRSIFSVGEQRDVRQWLWAADVMVLPSRYEGFPVAAAESMSTGTAVVATGFNGAREIIEAPPLSPGGIVVSIGDMDALLQGAIKLVSSPSLQHEVSTSARARAERLFTAEIVCGKLTAGYRDAIRLHGGINHGSPA